MVEYRCVRISSGQQKQGHQKVQLTMNRGHLQQQEISPDQLLKLFRSRPRLGSGGKLKQTEVAARVQVDVRAVQQWENGERLPSAENLKKLLQVFVDEGIFLPLHEREEAHQLWQAVRHAYEQRPGSTRLYPPFDEAWFTALLTQRQHERISVSPRREQPKTNLPVPLTSFVGRERERTHICQQLASARLVTVAGAGGAGKTRLALEVARDLLGDYSDGVWFLDFSTVREPAGITEAIARTLEVEEGQGQSLAYMLNRWLRHKHALLLLDNCEQFVEICASLVENWLRTCPHLHLLVTSRETLNLPGEHVFVLAPLPLPEVHQQNSHSLNAISSSAAVRLFVERARAVLPSFALTAENAPVLVQICQRLEGLPLAIELAAARMDLLSEYQLLAHLCKPLSFLVGEKRALQPQQQTLRASLDWSYHLLTAPEQTLLHQVSIFAGGWTLSALEALSEPEIAASPQETLQFLSRLVSKSLVVVERSTPSVEPRYRLLETVRQYSQERLLEQADQARMQVLQERHAAFYLHLVEESEPYLRSAQRVRWLRQVQQEYENIRVALSWYIQQQDRQGMGLRLVSMLYWFWLHQGCWSEGRRWLETLLALAHGRPQLERMRAKAGHGAGILARLQGRAQEAAHWARTSVAEAHQSGDQEILASCLRLSSLVLEEQGDSRQALAHAEESVALARMQGNTWSLATSLNILGILLWVQVESERARVCYEESILLLREVGDRWELSAPLRNLGRMMTQLGDEQRARSLYRESLSCAQEMKGTWFLSRTLEDIAFLLSTCGQEQQAATLFGTAETLRECLGATLLPFSTQAYQQSLNRLHERLSQKAFQAAWQKGRDLSAEQALAFAFQVL